jgi:hypothetical protein
VLEKGKGPAHEKGIEGVPAASTWGREKKGGSGRGGGAGGGGV